MEEVQSSGGIKEGDEVKPGDLLCEVETDKATMDYESSQSGTILAIVVNDGKGRLATHCSSRQKGEKSMTFSCQNLWQHLHSQPASAVSETELKPQAAAVETVLQKAGHDEAVDKAVPAETVQAHSSARIRLHWQKTGGISPYTNRCSKRYRPWRQGGA